MVTILPGSKDDQNGQASILIIFLGLTTIEDIQGIA
jgi:hypothetical protein